MMKRLSIRPLCVALAILATAGCSDRHEQECLNLYHQMEKEDSSDSPAQKGGNTSLAQDEGNDSPPPMTTQQKFRAHRCRPD